MLGDSPIFLTKFQRAATGGSQQLTMDTNDGKP